VKEGEIDMTSIPSPPSPALNRIAWNQAVAIATGLPWQPTNIECIDEETQERIKWVDEAAQERSKPLKNYYELICAVYRYDSSSFLTELYRSPVDLLDAIATNLLEEYQALRAYPEEEFPGRRSFIDGGRAETNFLEGTTEIAKAPTGAYSKLTNLEQWHKNPRRMLLQWAKALSCFVGEMHAPLEKVICDNRTMTHTIRKMEPWGNIGRKPRKKRTL
jgi:hypothetical protein